MSSIFDSYDEEYTALTQDISNNISHVTTYETDPAKKQTQFKHIDALVGQAESLLKQMEIEVRSTRDRGTKDQLMGKLTTYKKMLVALRSDYQQALQREERESLLGVGGANAHLYAQGNASREHRDRLLQTTDRLDTQGQRLQDSKARMMEIEDVAMDISSELGRNREKIEGVHGKVREVSSMTTNARRLVHSMNRREVQHRMIIYGVALLLLVGVGIAVYYSVK